MQSVPMITDAIFKKQELLTKMFFFLTREEIVVFRYCFFPPLSLSLSFCFFHFIFQKQYILSPSYRILFSLLQIVWKSTNHIFRTYKWWSTKREELHSLQKSDGSWIRMQNYDFDAKTTRFWCWFYSFFFSIFSLLFRFPFSYFFVLFLFSSRLNLLRKFHQLSTELWPGTNIL